MKFLTEILSLFLVFMAFLGAVYISALIGSLVAAASMPIIGTVAFILVVSVSWWIIAKTVYQMRT